MSEYYSIIQWPWLSIIVLDGFTSANFFTVDYEVYYPQSHLKIH